MYQNLRPKVALHPNFDTRDDCSKRVHRPGAERVQRMRMLPIKLKGKNRGMRPDRVRRVHMHRVQLLHAEVSMHPHRVQMHPILFILGNYDGVSQAFEQKDYCSYFRRLICSLHAKSRSSSSERDSISQASMLISGIPAKDAAYLSSTRSFRSLSKSMFITFFRSIYLVYLYLLINSFARRMAISSLVNRSELMHCISPSSG